MSHGMSLMSLRAASTGLSHPSRAHPLWDELTATFPKAKGLPRILGWEEGNSLSHQKYSQLHSGFPLSLSPPFLPYSSDTQMLHSNKASNVMFLN